MIKKEKPTVKKTVKKAETKKPVKEVKVKKEKVVKEVVEKAQEESIDVNFVQVGGSGVNLPYTVSTTTHTDSNGLTYQLANGDTYKTTEESNVDAPYTISTTNNDSNGSYIYVGDIATQVNESWGSVEKGSSDETKEYWYPNNENCISAKAKPQPLEEKLGELIDLLKNAEIVDSIELKSTQPTSLQELSFTDIYNIKATLGHTIGVNNYNGADSWAQRIKNTAVMRLESIEKEIDRRLSELNW